MPGGSKTPASGNLAIPMAAERPDAMDSQPVAGEVSALEQTEPTEAGEPTGEANEASGDDLREELQERLAAYVHRGRVRVVLTDNLHTMVSVKKGQGVVTFRLHHMFAEAPPAVLRALARYAEKQDRSASAVLRAFVDSHEHLVRERDTPRAVTCDVEGKFHNLQAIFDELNEQYFGNRVRARITWGPRTRRKRSRDSIQLGSYTVEDELIRIHPVLDARDVPRFFVGWIVYHEMLHELHDMPIVDGRRVYHTPEFRRAEAQYDRYAESVLWERTNLSKLLER